MLTGLAREISTLPVWWRRSAGLARKIPRGLIQKICRFSRKDPKRFNTEDLITINTKTASGFGRKDVSHFQV